MRVTSDRFAASALRGIALAITALIARPMVSAQEPPLELPQIVPATPTKPTPEPTPIKVPYELDPNVPGLSEEERKQRQQAYIRWRLEEMRKEAEAKANQALQELIKVQPGAPSGGLAEQLSPPSPEVIESEAASAKFRTMTFFLTPASIVVRPGEEFTTEARLLNLERLALTAVDLVLTYPPQAVEPVSLHQDAIKDALQGEPQWGIDRVAGEIRYRARFARPLRGLDMKILEVLWRAREPIEEAPLGLASPRAVSSAFQGSERITLNEFGPLGTLVGARLRVEPPPGPIPRGGRLVLDPGRDLSGVLRASGAMAEHPPSLWIDYPRKDFYEAGEWIVFDVGLHNPEGVAFDEVRVLLRFDPSVLDFADADQGNWIREGHNALDGPFADRWGWDRHLANRIDPAAGRIEYRMGYSRLAPRPSGRLLRLFGRLKAPARDPLLSWEWGREKALAGSPTGVLVVGRNLLEEAFARDAFGVASALLEAEPPQADPSVYLSRRAREIIEQLQDRLIQPPPTGSDGASPEAVGASAAAASGPKAQPAPFEAASEEGPGGTQGEGSRAEAEAVSPPAADGPTLEVGPPPQRASGDRTFLWGPSDRRYHRPTCPQLPAEPVSIKLSDARAKGLEPCAVCRTPK